jgi:hypothetical protein
MAFKNADDVSAFNQAVKNIKWLLIIQNW